MYSVSDIRRGLENPRLLFCEVNSLYHRKFDKSNVNYNGTNIFAEDWDTLVILDACRYDMFAERNTLSGRLKSRQSKGSSTAEFLEANFAERSLHDTVYTTANPQIRQHWERINPDLHAIIDVWKGNRWNKQIGTVLPEQMTEAAIDAIEQFPHKRHIIHYMQPHYPFVGSDTEFDRGHLNDPNPEKDNLWWQIMKGDLDPDLNNVQKYYYENLDCVFPHLRTLLEHIEGRTVITSDHGNMLGERAFPIPVRTWGHPRGLYTDELVTVPWLVVESGSRRRIISESPESADERTESDVVADRLRQLGYK